MIQQQHAALRYWQFEHFLQFPELIHSIFTRHGGYSEPPYHGLNTSTSLKNPYHDSANSVVRNRHLALQALHITDHPCITLWQIHSAIVMAYDDTEEWRTDWALPSYYEHTWTPTTIHKGDALITRRPSVALAFSFADCVPILLYDPVQRVIGIAHGGWRGSARGMALSSVEMMQRQFGCQPQDIRAGLGPAIGACCYEVSETVRDLFTGRQQFIDMPTNKAYHKKVRESATFSSIRTGGKDSLRLDLWATNYQQLLLAGLLPDHIEISQICTSCNRDSFFSHRGEGGRTGRFPVIIALR